MYVEYSRQFLRTEQYCHIRASEKIIVSSVCPNVQLLVDALYILYGETFLAMLSRIRQNVISLAQQNLRPCL